MELLRMRQQRSDGCGRLGIILRRPGILDKPTVRNAFSSKKLRIKDLISSKCPEPGREMRGIHEVRIWLLSVTELREFIKNFVTDQKSKTSVQQHRGISALSRVRLNIA
jgi:hypothetical protein